MASTLARLGAPAPSRARATSSRPRTDRRGARATPRARLARAQSIAGTSSSETPPSESPVKTSRGRVDDEIFARETTSIAAFHRRASWLARTGRFERAKTVALAALERRPEDATSAATSATACFACGDSEGGRAAMRRHRESLNGGDVSVVTLCAWAEAESTVKTREGEANARALRREATTSTNGTVSEMCDAWVAFGGHEQEHGRWDKAKKCYKRALDVAEGAEDARTRESAAVAAHSWARLEARERNPKRARELFVKSVELCESLVSNYTTWAAFELGRGRSDQARSLFERGAAFCRDVEAGDGNRGRAARRARAMASALFANWGELEGQCALRADGDASSSEDTIEKARELFNRACDVDKKNVAAWLKWSELEKDISRGSSHRGGVVTSARRNYVSNRRQLDVLSAGLKANPGEMRLEHAFAMALKLNGDVESATKRLERLSERFPKSSHVWHALGTTRQESGDFEGAIEAFERGSFASGKANLPCITAAAAAEFHGGAHGRARQLFVQGEAVPKHLSTRRERAAHLRLWALLEKRVGSEEMTRKLFVAATTEDRADAATWLQWGQWEKRVNSADAARKVFRDGVRYGTNNGQYFVYQALATLEAEMDNDDSARELFQQGCAAHPRSASLWLQWALFELSSSKEEMEGISNSIAIIKRGVLRAPPHIPLLELWLGLERRRGDKDSAAEVEARLKQLVSEQRYAPVGKEVK